MENKKIVLLYTLLLNLLLALAAEEVVTLPDGRQAVLFDDFTWRYVEQGKNATEYAGVKENQLPSYLRQGVKASQIEIITAMEMYDQGWRYTMPSPKSAQAVWGNSDRRTTWWYGYWHNEKTGLYSDSTPKKGQSGMYLGDNQDQSGSWRNGGSPGYPDVYMFLLSNTGGPRQR